MSGRYLLDTNAIINLLKDENANFIVKDIEEIKLKPGVFLQELKGGQP